MSTLSAETTTVRALLTKEKPYSTEILRAVHIAFVLHSADTRVQTAAWWGNKTTHLWRLKVTPTDVSDMFCSHTANVCSQPSKGGSQWSSSTLLQTEVDLALEWDWKTTTEKSSHLTVPLQKSIYKIKCHLNHVWGYKLCLLSQFEVKTTYQG